MQESDQRMNLESPGCSFTNYGYQCTCQIICNTTSCGFTPYRTVSTFVFRTVYVSAAAETSTADTSVTVIMLAVSRRAETSTAVLSVSVTAETSTADTPVTVVMYTSVTVVMLAVSRKAETSTAVLSVSVAAETSIAASLLFVSCLQSCLTHNEQANIPIVNKVLP